MEADEQLVPKRGNKGSVIRKFYGYRERGAGNPNMQSVQKTVPTKGSSTTNMFHHPKTYPAEYAESVKL